MAQIHKLSSEIIGQIAAGEVVERPASAVKELVENSIDAGAKNITVELRDGGIRYLRVADNGCGIPLEQIRLAFERHATSKLVQAEDLFDLHTLGFRGEALPSIAAVSRLTLTTCTKDAAFGTRCVVEGGEFRDIRQAASPVGTSIVVEDLFANVPARLKFLKKPAAEASAVADYISRLILSRPDISFRFVNQGKTLFHSPGDGKPESAVLSVFDRETLSAMKSVQGSQGGVLVRGFVGVGDCARGNHQQQNFFINGRYFRSALLSRAVDDACSGRIMVGRFPICVLYLDINPHNVDVNVHPNKLEVRFQNEAAVCEAVRGAVLDALSAELLSRKLENAVREEKAVSEPAETGGVRLIPLDTDVPAGAIPPPTVPSVSLAAAPSVLQEKPVSYQIQTATPAADYASMPSAPKEKPVSYQVQTPKPAASSASVPPSLQEKPVSYQVQAAASTVNPVSPPSSLPLSQQEKPTVAPAQSEMPLQPEPNEQLALPDEEKLRYIGSAFNTYLIFEGKGKVLVIDQHAAHERILYDKYLGMISAGKASQYLLSPQIVHLSPQEMLTLRELQPVLEASGFDLSLFDEKNVALRAVPMLFGVNASPKELLLEAIDAWDGSKKQITLERMRKRVAQMACKHAIKGGDALSPVQVQAFLDLFRKSDSYPTCPHGRPIVIEITQKDIEKRFSRIQP